MKKGITKMPFFTFFFDAIQPKMGSISHLWFLTIIFLKRNYFILEISTVDAIFVKEVYFLGGFSYN